jgi:two-component system, NtrC family, nitrogen regulation sensor histidine kinase NtrY
MISERLLHTRSRVIVLILLVVFYTATGFLLAKSHYTTAALLFVCGLLALWIEMRIYRFTNDAITYFFNALRNDDTTLQFPNKIKNSSLTRLYEGMNRLNRHFQDIRLQNEYNERYYKTLIRNSTTGLLVLNHMNEVELMNDVACRYAGISPDSTNPGIIKVKNAAFYEALCSLQPGENQTYKQISGNSVQMLLFKAIFFQKNDVYVKLISIQDIRQELEARELESYRKLISVLTHEIMNLLSPLSSVAGSLDTLYHPSSQPISLSAVNEDILRTTLSSIEVINEQSNGMMNFVNNYRKLSRIPRPEIKPFETDEWMDQLRIVYSEKMLENHIDFKVNADHGIRQIIADKKLINQVVVNLMNNAIDAVKEKEDNRLIKLNIEITRQNRIWICISNNGPAIPPEVQDKIFVPFFTTKEEGSGIGLSICQEIMKLHSGSLMVVSGHDNLTSFIIEI